MDYRQKLTDPPKQYRAVPFWSWNDKLSPDLLRWEIGQFDKTGHGGFFMHARGGLTTPYMGEEWMQAVEACLDEAKPRGMYAWCYDEEGWPSGFAGGRVTALGDEYLVRWLLASPIGQVDPAEAYRDASVLGVYRVAEGCRRLGERDPVQEAMVIRHTCNPFYVDLLSPKVVKAFLDSTYEVYHQRFAGKFGRAMPGFFTDEPQYARQGLPWSYVLPEAFRDRYGYDVLEMLPALFIRVEGYEKFRSDFWRLVNDLYAESFGKQVYDWCEAHGCELTGHAMLEEALQFQMFSTAGVMPLYEYMQAPGIDWLCRKIADPLAPKQVGSAASQLGKKFVLSEMFALCGWDVSFEELKWIAQWQYVNGVNRMCQHLCGYTLRGLRKRDFPPGMFYQSPWWDEYRLFNDYFARLGVLLADGEDDVRVLMMHPLRTAYIAYDGGPGDKMPESLPYPELEGFNQSFSQASSLLSGLHIEHHYGDERLLARHGRIEGRSVALGRCRYEAVVVPPSLSIDAPTLALLEGFSNAGGALFYLDRFPSLCGGIPEPRLDALSKKAMALSLKDEGGVEKALKAWQGLSLADAGGQVRVIHHTMRHMEDQRDMYYLVSHDQQQAYDTILELPGEGALWQYMPETNQTVAVGVTASEGKTACQVHFDPMEAKVFFYTPGQPILPIAAPAPVQPVHFDSRWQIASMDENVLTLDGCAYRIDGGAWEAPLPVIAIFQKLLALQRPADVELSFTFNVQTQQTDGMDLVVEYDPALEILVNGQRVLHSERTWIDSSFRRIAIGHLVRQGMNEVLIRRHFSQSQWVYDTLFGDNVLETEKNRLTYESELESIYILGRFGVRSEGVYSPEDTRHARWTAGPFVITDPPVSVLSGDLTSQGLCFFQGHIRLSQTVHIQKMAGYRQVLSFQKPRAILCKVYVNGTLAKILPWAPYEVDITDLAESGGNQIELEMVIGLRNALGPHHLAEGECYVCAPDSFNYHEGDPALWRDDYCLVTTGVVE